MKRLIILLFFPLCLSVSPAKYDLKVDYEKLFLDKIANAVSWVESRNNNNAIGKDGDYGKFQITKIRLLDYNRRTGKNYKRNQLFLEGVGREIFDFYAKEIGILEYEHIARDWNGGYLGHKRKATLDYWNLVS